jgi:hypothetical protein
MPGATVQLVVFVRWKRSDGSELRISREQDESVDGFTTSRRRWAQEGGGIGRCIPSATRGGSSYLPRHN